MHYCSIMALVQGGDNSGASQSVFSKETRSRRTVGAEKPSTLPKEERDHVFQTSGLNLGYFPLDLDQLCTVLCLCNVLRTAALTGLRYADLHRPGGYPSLELRSLNLDMIWSYKS